MSALVILLVRCAGANCSELNTHKIKKCNGRDILRTVRAVTGLLLDFSDGHRSEFAGSINRVLNALAHVDDMGYCQVRPTSSAKAASHTVKRQHYYCRICMVLRKMLDSYLYGCCGMS